MLRSLLACEDFLEAQTKPACMGGDIGRRKERNGGLWRLTFSCMTALAMTNLRLDSCRACLVTCVAFQLLLLTLIWPLLTLFATCVTLALTCLCSTFFPSICLSLSLSLSGKEPTNHTLRPGGPPPIPKSPSKVNTHSHTYSHKQTVVLIAKISVILCKTNVITQSTITGVSHNIDLCAHILYTFSIYLFYFHVSNSQCTETDTDMGFKTKRLISILCCS